MEAQKILDELILDEYQLNLNKEEAEKSLMVLKNAHHSLQIIISQLQQNAPTENEHLIEILLSELELIEDEMKRLDFYFENLHIKCL